MDPHIKEMEMVATKFLSLVKKNWLAPAGEPAAASPDKFTQAMCLVITIIIMILFL